MMRNVIGALADAYFQILNGNLTLNNQNVPVYDGVAPSIETGSYVVLGECIAIPTADKCTFTYDANILVDIVVKNGNFGYADSDAIGEQVGELINTWLNPTLTNFQAVTTNASFNRLPGLNPTETVFRTLIRYNHLITQNERD